MGIVWHRFELSRQVGSIDNDMCGFSMTIGFDTALQRIIAAIDALVTYVAPPTPSHDYVSNLHVDTL